MTGRTNGHESRGNESRRSSAYKYLSVPEVEHAGELDGFTRMAAWLTGTPIAFVCIVDGEHQHAKSVVGWDILGRQELPQDSILCSETVRNDEPLVVTDAKKDKRFKDDPMVTGRPSTRFFMGCPLVVNGQRIGMLCVIDRRERKMEKLVHEAMVILAHEASQRLELRAKVDQFKANKARSASSAHAANLQSVRTALAHVPGKTWVMNDQGSCWFANDEWISWVGLDAWQDAVDWYSGVDIDDLDRVRSTIARAIAERAAIDIEYRRNVSGGTPRWVRSSARPHWNEDGSFAGLVGCCADTTDKLTTRVELETLNAELAAANKELDFRSKEVMQLTFSLTHDLQTPLATMTGQAALMRNAIKTGGDVNKHLERMQGGIDRMTKMLDSLMQYARQGGEPLRYESVDVSDMILSAVEQFQPVADASGVLLCAAPRPATVFVDRAALERCIANVLSNAVKFTALSDGARQVGVEIKLSGERVRIVIADTGPGVPPSQLEKVFLPFKRANADAPGTGLGLCSVKRSIEAFGGHVWLESDGRTGTKAIIELPEAAAVQLAA